MPIGGFGSESIGTAFVRIIGDGDGLRDDIADSLEDADPDLERAGERHSKGYRKGFKRGMDKDNGFFRKMALRFETMADPLGRLLGRGSRNNFLNFFGSVVRNALFATGKVVDFFEAVIDGFKQIGSISLAFFKEFFRQGSQAANVAERFSLALAAAAGEGSITTLLTGGLNLVAGMLALGAAFAVAAFSAGALISALVLLSGIVIALAASISAALIAAVAAFLPLIVPLAGIIAGVVASVQMFKDANDKLKPSIAAVNKQASKLWDTFKDHALKGAPRLVDRVTKSMSGLDKFMAAAGDGFRNFAKAMVDSITGPEFKQFTTVFTEFLPSASRKLGIIFGNVFEGLGGFLTAAIPLANQLLNWLVKITDNFSEWANSKKGQQEIKDFLEKAAHSAKSLGGFLEQVVGLIGDFFTAGQETGDSIFDDMTEGLKNVRRFLEENPDALKNFFRDSKEFATTLGDAIKDIAAAIDRIDSPETRKAANWLIDILSTQIAIVSTVIAAFATAASAIAGWFTFLANITIGAFKLMVKAAIITVDGIIGLFAKIPGPGGRAARAIQDSFDNMAEGINADLDDLSVDIKGLEATANGFNPTMDINTAPAVAKLNILQVLINQIKAAIANANATHVSPNAAEHGMGPSQSNSGGGGGNGSGGGVPNGSKVLAPNITIVTPTQDPRAVATELLNRLAVVGY
jgi:hypothetical protein